MTKKQMKQFAAKLAKLEKIIQENEDEEKVRAAKEQMFQLNESVELDLDEMIQIDEMVSKML